MLFAALLSLLKQEYLDSAIIIIIIAISAIIYYVQQYSTERVLRALKKHDIQQISVYRDGQFIRLNSEELVPGDVFIIHEGEKVPADARILHSLNARADEAMLTGESEPVSKHHNPIQSDRPLYEQVNMVFQGSFVVSGEIIAVVTTTGNNTEYGKLAQLAGGSNFESPVQKKIDSLISKIVIAVVVVAIFAFILQIIRGYETSEALRFVLALAVSAVPEGLPIAISVILVLGMRKLAEKKALVRSMSAIENIGLVTLIATDKTGTLTKNKLRVQDVWELKSNDDLRSVAIAINKTVLVSEGGVSHDPLDEAFIYFAKEYHAQDSVKELSTKQLPFDQKHAMSGVVWRVGNDNYQAYVKGAPEKIIEFAKLKGTELQNAEKMLHQLTGQGLRVIAIAKQNSTRVASSFDELLEQPLIFIGLVAVADELREEASGAIALAKEAGVEVAMITGDHAETAFAIGKKIGLAKQRNEVFDTRKLSNKQQISESAIYTSKVFSRVTPENKYQLLHYFKKKHITAMTGDGVNDVPALTQAHIGIAMGSGTQVAKEAGDIVLLNDNFATIIDALREGRTIFANIRKMLFYLLATTVGMVITMIGSLIVGLPLPVLAIQILWINLVTDTALVIPIGLEPAERDVMKQSPRKPDQPILDNYMVIRIILVGIVMASSAIVVFAIFLQNYSEEYARTVAFMVLVAMQWANAFNARSDTQLAVSRLKVFNSKFAIGLSLSVGLQMLAIFGPLASALNVESIAFIHILIPSIIAGILVVTTAELHKLWQKFKKSKTT